MTAAHPPHTAPERRLSSDALTIFRAGLAAVDPEPLVRGALERSQGAGVRPPTGGRLIVVSVGKAGVPMAHGAVAALGEEISEGVVLAPDGAGGRHPEGFRVHRGGHPLPTPEGVLGARDVQGLVSGAGPLDRILLLVSGGGSALLTLPHPGVSLEDVRRVTQLLMHSGATIQELNAVRKHLEALKGGRLAALAAPAPLTALILSDVVGDPLDVIASGPVAPDRSTFDEAVGVLEDRGVWDHAPEAVRAHLQRGREGKVAETPKEGDAAFAGVRIDVVGNAALAARRAAEAARRLGYVSHVDSATVTGEARQVGADIARSALGLAASARGPACVVYAGETTVTVRGDGRGGRNQELALAAAGRLVGRDGVLVFSAGTDGLDGPTPAAGALAMGSTIPRALSLGLDAEAHLTRNDSFHFFEALGDLVVTGATGTNVMDLMFAMSLGFEGP